MDTDFLFQTALHESWHSGCFYSHGIAVKEVAVNQDGSGHTRHVSLDHFALYQLYTADREAALSMVLAHMSGGLAPSLARSLEANQADLDYVDEMTDLWGTFTSLPSAQGLYALARAQARCWLLTHQTAAESFARQLMCRRRLSGDELQQRLAKTFRHHPAARSTRPAHEAPLSVWDFPARQQRRPSAVMSPLPAPAWRTGGVFVSAI
jgi:hypothetical protein